MNLYKEFEDIFHHQSLQVEKQLQNQRKFNWSDSETAEILSHSLNQPGYHVYIVDETGKQIFGPDTNQESPVIPISDDILSQVQSGKLFSKGGFENGELRYTIATMLTTSINEVEQPIMVMVFNKLNHEYQRVIWMILFTFFIAIVFAGIILWFMSVALHKKI